MENKKRSAILWSIIALIGLILLTLLGINFIGKKENPIVVASVQDNGTSEVVYGNTDDLSFSFLAEENAQGDVTYELVSQKNEDNKTVDYFKLVSERDNQIKVDKKINAGTYTLTIRVNAKGNNKYRSSSKDITYLYTVNKAKGKIDKVPAAVSNLVYNGKPQKLITPGESSTGKMLYKVNDGEYSEKIPEATDAGIYTVYFKVEGDENHEDVKEGYLLSSIDNGKSTSYYRPSSGYNTGFSLSGLIKTITDSSSIKYNPTPVGNKPRRNVEYTYDGNVYSNGYNPPAGVIMTGVSSGVNAGVYRAIYAPDLAHCWSDNSRDPVMVTLTIKKADPTVEFDIPVLYYDSSAQELLDGVEVEGGSIAFSLDDRIYTRSIPRAVNAGTYTVYYKVQGDRNHNDLSGSFEVTILKRPLIIPSTTSEFTYDMLPHAVDIDDYDFTTMYIVPSSDLIKTNAGLYFVEIEIRDPDNNEWENGETDSVVLKWRILEAEGSISIDPKPRDLTYNGKDQTLVSAGISLTGTMQYRLGETGEFDSALPKAMNAGKYNVYYYSQGSRNYKDTDVEVVEVEIKKADPAIKEYPQGLRIKVDGELHNLVTRGETDDGHFEYRVGKSSWSTEIPKASAEGDYWIEYRVIGDRNHNDTEAESVFTVLYKYDDATYTVEPEPIEDLVYDGNSHKLCTKGDSDEGTVVYSLDGENWSKNIPEATDAGKYEVLYMIIGDATHVDSDVSSFEVVINKAFLDVTLPVDDYVYNGEPQGDPVIAKTVLGEDAKIEYRTALGTYSEVVPQYEDVKTDILGRATSRTIYFRANAENHEEATGSYTITIEKKEFEVPYIKDNSIEYTGEEISPVIENYEFEYMSISGKDSATDVGNYILFISLDDKKNTQWTEGNSLDRMLYWTIERASVELVEPEAIEGLVYDTNSHELVTPGEAIGGTIKFSLDGRVFTEEIPTGIYDGFYIVYYRVDADSNHVSRPATEILAIIDAAQMTVNAPDQRYVFDYQAHGEPITDVITVDGSEFSVIYSDSEEAEFVPDVPVRTEAGTYTIYFVVGADHHYPVGESYNIIIDKADGVIESLPVANSGLVYNGQVQQLLASGGNSSTGTMMYSLDNENYSTETPSVVNAGDYIVYYYSKGDNNHNDTSVETLSVSVERATVDKPDISGNEFDYDGNYHGPDVTKYDHSLLSVTGNESEINAGDYVLVCSIIDKTNYKWTDGTDSDIEYNWVINKVPAEIISEPSGIKTTYNGLPQQLVVDGEVIGGEILYTLDGINYVPAEQMIATNANNYEVTYKVQGDSNHLDSKEKYYLKSIILPGTAQIERDPTAIEGLVYNGAPQQLILPGVANFDTDDYSIIMYSVNGERYSYDIPMGLNAGTYIINYMIDPTDNYSGTDEQQLMVTIDRAENPLAATQDPVTFSSVRGTPGRLHITEYLVPGAGELNYEIVSPHGRDFHLDGEYLVSSSQLGQGNHPVVLRISTVGDLNHKDKSVTMNITWTVRRNRDNSLMSTSMDDSDYTSFEDAFTESNNEINPLYELLENYVQIFGADGKLKLFKESSED